MSCLLHSLSLSLLLLILFPFLFFISMADQSNDTRYPSCLSYNCANITISYPFWRLDSETPTQFCGYGGFGINCSNNVPVVYFGSDSYYIPNINYESKSIVLVDYDVSPVVPAVVCPRVRHSIDWGDMPFNFWGQNVNLSFHFNCTGVPDFAREIPCLSTSTNKSCVNDLNYEPENFSWTVYSCDDEVVTTVFDVFSSTMALETEFSRALRQGFELKWGRMEDCQKCEESGGRCGHNNSTTELMCFCSGGAITMAHCKGSGTNWTLKLVLGIVSAFMTITLVLIVYCISKFSPSNCVALFKHQTEDEKSVEAFVIQYGSLSTKRYTYADIKKMTNSFRVKLGQGGFGTVFKGKLSDGRPVAVKVLNSSKASGLGICNPGSLMDTFIRSYQYSWQTTIAGAGAGAGSFLRSKPTACTICMDEFFKGDNIIRLPCHHYFHRRCIRKWLSLKKNCPICRRTIAIPAAPLPLRASRRSNSKAYFVEYQHRPFHLFLYQLMDLYEAFFG